jgi:hypothetical protein
MPVFYTNKCKSAAMAHTAWMAVVKIFKKFDVVVAAVLGEPLASYVSFSYHQYRKGEMDNVWSNLPLSFRMLTSVDGGHGM